MILKSKKTRELVTGRVGIHYFPDTSHYTNKDLSDWLPVLQQLKCAWLVLLSDTSRAIPEQFITALIKAGITPLVHIPLPLPNTPSPADLKAILAAYARWGVKHIILFDRPNDMVSWSAAGWVQQNLVERFVDRFLPLAMATVKAEMMPIFPPLQPGGSYWDLSFLKQSLQSIQRRGYSSLIEQMGLASFAFTFNHELDYGAGGPQKWPKSLPYITDAQGQDQRGFFNFEWLQATARTVCVQELPIFMLGAGIREPGQPYSPEMHAGICLSILEMLKENSSKNAIPDYVKSCNFYLLSAEPDSEEFACAWYKSPEDYLPVADLLMQAQVPGASNHANAPLEKRDLPVEAESTPIKSFTGHPIEHYLLIPAYEWGVADFHLDVTRAFIQKHRPTIGFSIREAALARRVTVIGGEQSFPETALEELRRSGSVVERISGDGTSIATQLAER